jgi:chitin disaccharide deacetylase
MSAAIESSAPRRIWLCADDYGISASVNTAIRDLVVRDRLNAASVLVAAPSFHRAEAISLSVLNSIARRVAIGLHVALTAPFRPLSTAFSPLADGRFLPLRAVLGHALLRRFSHDALKAEIATQLQTFISAFGRTPDFIDGHQHVQLFPQIGKALIEVAKETAPDAWLRQCGRVLPFGQRFADHKGLLLDILSVRFRRRARAHGLVTNPAFAGTYDFHDQADFAALFPRFLERMPGGGLIMCHPGFVDAELQRLDPLTTLREQEYAYLAGDEFPGVLESRGLALA